MPQYVNRRHQKHRRRLLYGGGVVGASLIASTIIVGSTMGAETGPSNAAAAQSPPVTPAEIGFWPPLPGELPDPRLTVAPTTTPSSTPSEKPSSSPTSSPTESAPSPTQSPPPTTSPSAPPTSGPPATPTDGFPDASTTGVPAGVELTESEGLTITEDGTVIDAQEITGTVKVEADDVVIQRSKIISTGRYPIEVRSGAKNLLVEDTEIDGDGVGTIAILRGEYTLRRVNIHSVHDGPRIEGHNVVIEDSYLHDLHRVPDGHHDTIQFRQGTNAVIRNNYLAAYNASTDDPMNAAIQFGSLLGPIDDILVEGNLMNGGNYTVNASKLGGGDVVFQDNRFMRDYRYGILSSGPGLVWEDSNVDHETGESVS